MGNIRITRVGVRMRGFRPAESPIPADNGTEHPTGTARFAGWVPESLCREVSPAGESGQKKRAGRETFAGQPFGFFGGNC